MSDVKMIILDGAGNVICQHVEVKGDWVVVQNPVVCSHNEEENRLNMNPLLRFGQRDTNVELPMSAVKAVFEPTDGLRDEYIAVFIEKTKDPTQTEVEEEVEEEVAEETVESE
tara:strand:- start:229 stop:567 length:339 start_codon:yes stop_codon:yes gene_type:complete